MIVFSVLALFVPLLASAAEQSLEARRAALNRIDPATLAHDSPQYEIEFPYEIRICRNMH